MSDRMNLYILLAINVVKLTFYKFTKFINLAKWVFSLPAQEYKEDLLLSLWHCHLHQCLMVKFFYGMGKVMLGQPC